MRKRYDFSGGVRGKYARQYADGTTVAPTESNAEAPRGAPRPAESRTLRQVSRSATKG
jgi:hypothetical protein